MQDVLVIRQGRAGAISAVVLSIAVCLVGLWWTVTELPETKGEKPDSAGVLALLPSLVGVVLGGWGSWAGIRALRAQRTAPLIAEEFAERVERAEGTQYRQLLGSGRAAPDGRIDLAFTVTAAGVDGSRPAGTLEEIADFYRSLRPGRMVITGTPSADRDGRPAGDAGTGKTVLALSLILGLTKGRSQRDPVPVRLTAASWPGSDIRTWLRTHLTDVYQLPRRDAARLVEANLVLPVIDGLDEVDPGTAPGYRSRAAQLFRQIDEFEHGGTHCPVVVTCRHAHYQALVEAEAEPRTVAHVAVARVDAARAHGYLSQRVAGTEKGQARWQPILAALDAVATTPATTVPPERTLLAEALDTPWRLTLAATVFQERDTEGRYLRDPADLLARAAGGHLYEYLLDHFISAAVAAPHRATGDTSRPSGADGRPRLDADATWRHLAFLARYLKTNRDFGDGSPRRVAGRTLSGTDLVLHELWPLGGKHWTRWTERVLVGAFPMLMTGIVWLDYRKGWGAINVGMVWPLLSLFWVVLYRPAWPEPRRFDLNRLRTSTARHALAKGLAAGIAIGIAFISAFVVYDLSQNDDYHLSSGDIQFHLGEGLATGLPLGLAIGVALGLMTKRERAGVAPHHLIREDFTAAVAFGPVATVGFLLLSQFALLLTIPFFSEIHIEHEPDLYWRALSIGTVIGLIVFTLPVAGGAAALRYFALLLRTRRNLPWRLGRFLDHCYQLGVLRVSGTAYQFRHRELQDHLATRPTPPPRP
ncbi:hypothetical protein ABTZ59_34670 [Streptomyces sp. NPDC094034]|uniref:hypothetical protein n=1 Tax=Streptomyces sp. NPDC094034 TaxID=3155309 RepID=UPI00332C68E7